MAGRSLPTTESIMKRVGWIVRIRPEKIEEYKRYHAEAWPEVVAMIKKCNIRNYSIYLKDDILFSYFEYTGKDLKADLALMGTNKKTLEWWAILKPMLIPFPSRQPDEFWTEGEEVF